MGKTIVEKIFSAHSGKDIKGKPFTENAGEFTKSWDQEFSIARCLGMNKPMNYCRIIYPEIK